MKSAKIYKANLRKKTKVHVSPVSKNFYGVSRMNSRNNFIKETI